MADMQDLMQMQPIGSLRSIFQYKNGTPRQPSLCSTARGSLTIDKSVFNNPEHALEGLDQFSHAWIVFVFHKNKPGHSKAKVKPPRLNGKRVGVFSTRSPYRPNAIGLTLAKIERICGATIHFSGIDIVDGTPILDIKPFIPQYDVPVCRGEPCTTSIDDCMSNNIKVDSDCFNEGREVRGGDACTNTNELTSDICHVHANINCASHTDGQIGEYGSAEKLILDSEGICESQSSQSSDPQEMTCHVTYSSTWGHSAREAITENETKKPSHTVRYGMDGDPRVSSEELSPMCFRTKYDRDCLSMNTLLNTGENKNAESLAQQERVTTSSSGATTNASIEKLDTTGVTSLDMSGLSSGEQSLIDSKSREEYSSTTEQLQQITDTALRLGNSSAGPSDTTVAAWLSAPPISKLAVSFTPTAEMQLEKFVAAQKSDSSDQAHYKLDFLSGKEEIREAIVSVLSEDPRSVYRRQKCKDALYFFTVDLIHVTCWFDENRAEVVRLQPLILVEKLFKT